MHSRARCRSCADELDIAARPAQSSLSHKEVRHMFLRIEHKLLPKDSDMHFTSILHRGGNQHWEHGDECFYELSPLQSKQVLQEPHVDKKNKKWVSV